MERDCRSANWPIDGSQCDWILELGSLATVSSDGSLRQPEVRHRLTDAGLVIPAPFNDFDGIGSFRPT